MPPRKRKSSFVASDDSDAEGGSSATKRTKATASSSAFKPSSDLLNPQTDSENNAYWEISKARRVTISSYNGKLMVSVREHYEKDGKWLPGKKGISMTLEQWNTLLEVVPGVEKVLQEKGATEVSRPSYGGVGNGVVKDEDTVLDEVDKEDEGGRANHEATSDEE